MGNSGVPSLLCCPTASFSRCWFRARTPQPQLFAAAVAELRLIDCRFSADKANDLIEPRVLVRVDSSFTADALESVLLVERVDTEGWLRACVDADSDCGRRARFGRLSSDALDETLPAAFVAAESAVSFGGEPPAEPVGDAITDLVDNSLSMACAASFRCAASEVLLVPSASA